MHDGSFSKLSPVFLAERLNAIYIYRNCENDTGLTGFRTFSLSSCGNLNVGNSPEMSADTRTPLLTDREKIYSVGDQDHEMLREDSTDSQLTALADQLGLQPDAFSATSSERENNNPSKRVRYGPINDSVVTISQEQLEELLTALDTTRDMIRQVGMNSVELENLTRRRR